MRSILAGWHWHHPASAASIWEQAEARSERGMQTELKLATWNVWGLPFVSTHRKERIAAIAEKVVATGADVACFQEVFLEADRRVLCEILAEAGLTHWRYFSSLPVGSGLLTVSRYPITETVFLRFSKGGDPLAFQHGDWWAGKGAGVVTLDVPGFGAVRVVNSHLHASYYEPRYNEVRETQLAELMALLHLAKGGRTPVLLLGDLNYLLTDAHWQATMQAHGLVRLARKWSDLDYILALTGAGFTFSAGGGQPLAGTLADGQTSLSDHTGVFATVTIRAVAD